MVDEVEDLHALCEVVVQYFAAVHAANLPGVSCLDGEALSRYLAHTAYIHQHAYGIANWQSVLEKLCVYIAERPVVQQRTPSSRCGRQLCNSMGSQLRHVRPRLIRGATNIWRTGLFPRSTSIAGQCASQSAWWSCPS